MGVQANNPAGLTRQTKVLTGIVALFAAAGVLLRVAAPQSVPMNAAPTAPAASLSQTVSPAEAAPGAAAPTSAPASRAPQSGAVQILIMTTDTKAEWLREVTQDFTETRPVTSAGLPIEV